MLLTYTDFTMASTNVIKMGWEQMIDLYVEHRVLQLKARTTTCNHATSLHLYIHNEIDHSATAKALAFDEDVVKELQIICETDAKKHEEVMTVFRDDIKAKENSGKTKEQWEIDIDADTTKAIADVTARLSESGEKAKAAIRAAPEPAREPAAKSYIAGQDAVMQVFNVLLEQLNATFNAIVDFLKKAWEKLTKAWHTVVDAVSTGINVIKLIFGSSSSEPVVPTTETTPIETEKISECYTGRVIWKESVDFLTACAAYTKICGSLENDRVSNQLHYVINSRIIQNSTGKSTQATVVFYCKGLDVQVDLAKVWEEHVTKEEGPPDTWYIPEGAEPTTAMQEDSSHIPNGGAIKSDKAGLNEVNASPVI